MGIVTRTRLCWVGTELMRGELVKPTNHSLLLRLWGLLGLSIVEVTVIVGSAVAATGLATFSF
jgi:hypothetical protein